MSKDNNRTAKSHLGKTVSRRNFLKNTALAGLTTFGLPVFGNALFPSTGKAQALEPFTTPPANSLSEKPALGAGKSKRPEVDFTQEMRNSVIDLSKWAKRYVPNFSVIALNGIDLTEMLETQLFINEGKADPARGYIRALDGLMIEGPFYGYETYGEKTAKQETDYVLGYFDRLKPYGLRYMALDYASDSGQINAARKGFDPYDGLYYAAPKPHGKPSSLAKYPARPINENADSVDNLIVAKNYAIILDSTPFGTKDDYIAALANTNFDILIIDAFHRGTVPLTYQDMKNLRYKTVGTPRKLFAYLNIGAAETFRYYWKDGWKGGSPEYIDEINNNGRLGEEHHVRYWDPEWKKILYGTEDSYLGNIMKLGFDGVLLGGLNEYLWWRDY